MPDTTTQREHAHERIEIRTECPECGKELARQTFNRADLEQQQMTELPNREAMSLVNANLAIPVNLGLAANILSDGAAAGADASQTAPITQGI
jgi:hypothetical protein